MTSHVKTTVTTTYPLPNRTDQTSYASVFSTFRSKPWSHSKSSKVVRYPSLERNRIDKVIAKLRFKSQTDEKI